jgi:ArsR family transcriptional regulator, arsenate/arsenite/antimonite-responsive transcriptional repressor / arsenate reductase (thioredoxin)
VLDEGDLVITVCDAAHEELPGDAHWSVADPARTGDDAAFDRALAALAARVTRLAPAIHLPEDP